MGEFTHFNKEGNAVMVDVHAKDDTYRVAVAAGKIYVNKEVYAAIKGHTAKKEMSLEWRVLPGSWRRRKIRN